MGDGGAVAGHGTQIHDGQLHTQKWDRKMERR